MRLVGITTTVPIEIIMAGGAVPVDLNNLFITHPQRQRLVSEAENFGFPHNLCAWVKGIFQVAKEAGIREVVGVTRGDCSSTEKLLEVYSMVGIKKIPFAFPASRSPDELNNELKRFAKYFRTTLAEAERARQKLSGLRKKLAQLDRLTWQSDQLSGGENHLWLVSGSDFNRDPQKFERELDNFLAEAVKRKPFPQKIRLAYLGVPPIFDDLYSTLEQMGARVVYNELQREYAMLKPAKNLVEQYRNYTYPYDIFFRAREIARQIKKRRVQGIIHYAQTFCHRQIESMVFRKLFSLPILSIEGDCPGPLETRLRTRLEAFLEMLKAEE
jgi:benzoyl-CoA reductase/2-hydroxyglutaryl-CoA dehydratase subunit BcrC/BadD/HgdB